MATTYSIFDEVVFGPNFLQLLVIGGADFIGQSLVEKLEEFMLVRDSVFQLQERVGYPEQEYRGTSTYLPPVGHKLIVGNILP